MIVIRQRETVHQTYWDVREKRRRSRPVQQFSKTKVTGPIRSLKPGKKAKWGDALMRLFGKAA